jgi:hypothetical protein
MNHTAADDSRKEIIERLNHLFSFESINH